MEINDRRIAVTTLIRHKKILKHMQSFTTNVDRCNFKVYIAWNSKTYVEEQSHGIDEYRPEKLRGVDVLNLYYLRINDTVVLTEDQYKDYKNLCLIDE